MCNYTRVPTFSILPRPRTGPEGSRRCCWPAVCQTFLGGKKQKTKQNKEFSFFFFFNELHQNLVLSETLIKLHKLLDILTDQVDFAIALHVVKGRVDPGGFAMQHCKPAPIGFPGEGNDALCDTNKKHYIHALVFFPPISKCIYYIYSADKNFNKVPCSWKRKRFIKTNL